MTLETFVQAVAGSWSTVQPNYVKKLPLFTSSFLRLSLRSFLLFTGISVVTTALVYSVYYYNLQQTEKLEVANYQLLSENLEQKSRYNHLTETAVVAANLASSGVRPAKSGQIRYYNKKKNYFSRVP